MGSSLKRLIAAHDTARIQDDTLEIPDDLIIEILLRLPIHSILRFRSLSKSYCREIDGPYFIRAHKKLLTETCPPKLIMRTRSMNGFTAAYMLDLDSINCCASVDRSINFGDCYGDLMSVDIVGCCSGVLCLLKRHVYPLPLHIEGTFQIWDSLIFWNPMTKCSRRILVNGGRSRGLIVFKYYFGQDEANDDLKILAMPSSIQGSQVVYGNFFRIYSSRNNSWKYVNGLPGLMFRPGRYTDVFVEGTSAVHFTAFLQNEQQQWDDKVEALKAAERLRVGLYSYILAFNFETESLSPVPLPEQQPGVTCRYRYITGLSVLGGCLCFSERILWGMGCLVVWKMKEYGIRESWVKLFSFNDFISFPLMALNMVAIAYVDDHMLFVSALDYHPELYFYDIDKKKLRNVYLSSASIGSWDNYIRAKFLPFTPSLVRP